MPNTLVYPFRLALALDGYTGMLWVEPPFRGRVWESW